MAKKNKTTETEVSVTEFINNFADSEQKKSDAHQLVGLMRQWSGYEPKMWGPTIIGFGKYHYKYPSGHQGEAPLLGFSPRKAEFSLYVTATGHDNKKYLEQLGKFRKTKSCIYFKKLADLNIDVLEKLSKATIRYTKENANTGC